jgi:hypothetical protein
MSTVVPYNTGQLIHEKLYEVFQFKKNIGNDIRGVNTPQIRITIFPQRWRRAEDGRLEILKARVDVLELIVPD